MTRYVTGPLLGLAALLCLWAVLPVHAQDVLLGNIRLTGTTDPRTYTLPDTNGQLVMTATPGAWHIAAGTITLDGTNPSSATTGLAAIVACSVSDRRSTAPGSEVAMLTTITDAVAGQLDVYAWTATAAGNTALIASTDNNDVIGYVCIGS